MRHQRSDGELSSLSPANRPISEDGTGVRRATICVPTSSRTYELGTAYRHIAIGVDDLDGTLARLREQGIEPEREPYRVREGGSRLCFVNDPDGYRIELIER